MPFGIRQLNAQMICHFSKKSEYFDSYVSPTISFLQSLTVLTEVVLYIYVYT